MEDTTCPTCIFCDAGISCSSSGDSGSSEPYDACADLPLEVECPKAQDQQASLLYGSLEPLETWQIRILELQPGTLDTPLVGRLFNADILFRDGVIENGTNRRYKYVAISYFWGEDQTPRHLLRCNDIDFPIPREAYRALHRVRDSTTPVCVWIDTVCINQHDKRDKSSQAARMRYTYQYASKVAVYLGELSKPGQTSTPSEKAVKNFFDFLQEYWPLHSTVTKLHFATYYDRFQDVPPMCANHASLIEHDLPELLHLKWFNQIWVMQEVWAARSIEMHYGNMSRPWAALESFKYLMGGATTNYGSTSPHYGLKLSLQSMCAKLRRLAVGTPVDHAAADMDEVPKHVTLNLEQDLFIVMERAEGAEYSCVHDCIYGLLSMTSVKVHHNSASRSPGFFVSYAEHPATTFIRLAEYVIQRDRTLNILLSSNAFPLGESGAGEVEGRTLPSWVPDWRFPLGGARADSFHHTWESLPPETLAVHGVLRCRGFILGAITSWCPYRETRFMASMDLESTVATVQWTHRLLRGDTEPQYHAPFTLERGDVVAVLEGLKEYIVLLRPARTTPTTSAGAYHYVGRLADIDKDEEAVLSGHGDPPSDTDFDYRALERGLEDPVLNDLKVIDLV